MRNVFLEFQLLPLSKKNNFNPLKANIHSGKFQPVQCGMVRFLLFSENISSRVQEIYFENKRKRTIPYRTG